MGLDGVLTTHAYNPISTRLECASLGCVIDFHASDLNARDIQDQERHDYDAEDRDWRGDWIGIGDQQRQK
jgi:hypothetical protein